MCHMLFKYFCTRPKCYDESFVLALVLRLIFLFSGILDNIFSLQCGMFPDMYVLRIIRDCVRVKTKKNTV